MKKLWNIISLSLIGSWFYYNIYFVIVNRYFDGNSCFPDKMLLYIIPLPGSMDNYSWLMLAVWLLSGLLLCLLQARGLRTVLFFAAFFVAIIYSYWLGMTNSLCYKTDRCSVQLTVAVRNIQAKAYQNLDPVKCRDLASLENNCKDAYTYQPAKSCAAVVSKLISYRDVGINIGPCQKKLTNCQSEYFQFFHDQLSNDLEAGVIQCEQKFSFNQAAQDLCHAYLNEWRKRGVKPILVN
ncbi:MAG: hypothetical protein WCO55_01100 [Candidatus Falkowbacteria bacterium]